MKTPAFHFHPGADVPPLRMADGLPAPETMAAATEHPDARVFLTNADGLVIAHAALWWAATPVLEGSHVGAIGGFAARDELAAKLLLHEAADRLRGAGCRIAVGPMNGNTWRRHRYVTESDGRGPFLLEPRNPAEYPDWWRSAGFSELSRYSSSVIALDGQPTVEPWLAERLERSGLVIRPLDPDHYDDDLRRIYAISLRSFAANFLYTPLDEEDFLEAYRKVRGQVDPCFVRIAERAGEPCGFVFAIRDLEAEARGETPALIVKTLAVDPDSRSTGLGSLLVDQVQRLGFDEGYREAIHAMQYQTNTSLKITARCKGRVFRRYALLSKPL
jgi:GNAT superfamily N-acetyltransferase